MSWGQNLVNHLTFRTPDAPRRGVTFADAPAGPPGRRYGRCPECGEFVAIDPQGTAREAPCPGCGLLVRPADLHWPIRVEDGPLRLLPGRRRPGMLRRILGRLLAGDRREAGAVELWDAQVDGQDTDRGRLP